MSRLKWIALALFLASCAPANGPHKPVAGESPSPGDAQTASAGAPGYDQVRDTFQRHCATCHPSRSAPNWLDFAQAQTFARNGRLLLRVFEQRSMPPPGSPEAATITEDERRQLASWARAGGPRDAAAAGSRAAPEGPPPPPPTLAQTCAQCHGENGQGNANQLSAPRLAGQSEIYLRVQLQRFKWRERLDPGNAMNNVAASLTDADIRHMAATFASTSASYPAPEDSIAGQFARGRDLAATNCNACHMNREFNNRSNLAEVPVLAGQSETYLRNQLLYFRNRERDNPIMNQIARDFKDEDIAVLSVYYSRLR